VIRACKELYERGYIEKWRRGQGHTNYYFINPLSFPRSFRRTSREPAESMILDVRAPARREHCTSSPPRPLDAVFSECQDDTSRSDTVTHPEVTNWHPNQTKRKQIQEKEIDSNASSPPQKGMEFPVAYMTTRNEQQQEAKTHTQVCVQGEQAAGRNNNNEPGMIEASLQNKPSKSNNSSPSPYKQTAAGRAKDVKVDKIIEQQTKQAAIAQATGIPQNHLEEMEIAQAPAKRPLPDFLKDIITRYSRELGDSSTSTKSNITRTAKLYFFALDYIKEAQENPQGFFSELLYDAKQAAYKVNNIRYWNANKRPNRMPVFFACLENRFELSDDEQAYIRSDEPLFVPSWKQ
jgi:hypothetical protein